MLPTTARIGDIVEVTNEENKYQGRYGKLTAKLPNPTIEFDGSPVSFNREELKMRARVGTNMHRELTEELELKLTKRLTAQDYRELIDHALLVKEVEWARDLYNRMEALKKSRG